MDDWIMFDPDDEATWPPYGQLVLAWTRKGGYVFGTGAGNRIKVRGGIVRRLHGPIWWEPLDVPPAGAAE